MGKKFNAHVAVQKDYAEVVWFHPGDEVPAWAKELVGDHVLAGDHEADDSVDVRLTDPENEPDEDETKWATVNTLPPPVDQPAADVADEEELDLDTLKKDELVELASERGLDTSGTKAELKERILADQEADDEEDDEE